MVAVEDVDAFGVVPGEALGGRKAFGCDVGVGKGDDAVVDVDVVPEGCR